MFNRLFVLLIFVFIGILGALVFAFGEEFAEKILPIFLIAIVLVYIFLSWYLGYFFSTQKPPLELVIAAAVGIAVAFMSGYYMGR